MNLCLFFEGTGQGVAGKVTNVTRLRDVCAEDARQRLHLEPGPGTRFGSYVRGSLAGVDWQDVFRSARRWFEGNYMSLPSDDVATRVFLFGFSRGALIARHFAEWLDKLGIPVAYLGLWDTVDSTIGLDVSETCPPNVKHARHAVARDETRRFFQYVPLKSCGKGDVMEMVFPGCHSDVGGLYDDNHLMADLALAWVATGARKAGLRIRKGERIVQRLDKSSVVLHDSHALVSNLWGAFGRIKRDLRGLRLHRLCRHLVASFVILATLAIAPCLAPTAHADANPAGCAQPATRTILIHSHNDYAQKRPFWGAYEAGADSIEADVFLVDGELIVAHSRRNLKPENTLRRLYLEPLREVFRKNGGRVRANGKPLQLLVDLKNGKQAFDALVVLIEREGFRDCFDISKNPAAARLTITGDNSAIDFSACPAFVFFDVPSNRKLDAEQYKRVWLVSDYARIYTKWRSGEMKEEDKRKIREAAAQAHAKGVLFRLWGFPDHADAWRLSLELGLDYINTDRPSAVRPDYWRAEAAVETVRLPAAGRVDLLHLSHVHRGGGKLERPDNTLETFKWCWENGSALECDCRKTKDGVGVMLHDDNLKRTGRGISAALASKSVSKELTWDEIKDVDVGSYLDPNFAHHRIPTIEATFAAMKGHPTYLCFVDEKGAGPKYIAAKAKEAGVLDQVYYTGQNYQKALAWNKATNGGKTLIWIGTWPRPKHTAADIARFEAHFEKKMDEMRANHFKGVSAVSLHTYYDPKAAEPFVPRASYLKKIIAEFHANGIPVCSIPFEGGETEEVYFRLHELGCDGFSTDYPSVMFSVIRKLKARTMR